MPSLTVMITPRQIWWLVKWFVALVVFVMLVQGVEYLFTGKPPYAQHQKKSARRKRPKAQPAPAPEAAPEVPAPAEPAAEPAAEEPAR